MYLIVINYSTSKIVRAVMHSNTYPVSANDFASIISPVCCESCCC
jgi:hypothetical protein